MVGSWSSRCPGCKPNLTNDGITVDLDIVEPVLRDPQLAALVVQLHRAAERRRPAFELKGSLHDLIADIADRSPTTRCCSSLRTPRIRAALERLHGDIARTATLDELASIAEMSRYALVRRFKAEIGLPPHTRTRPPCESNWPSASSRPALDQSMPRFERASRTRATSTATSAGSA